MMAQHRGGPFPRHARWLATSSGATLLGLALLGVVFLPSAAAGPGWDPPAVSWTNGLVLCEFPGAQPVVSFSDLNLTDSGLTVGLASMSEIRSDGTVAAAADLANASWTVTNASTDDAYDLAFTTEAPVVSTGSPPHALGSVDLRVDYVLAAYAETPSTSINTVAANLSVSNWTWQNSSDRLEMTYAAAPSYPSSEHLATTSEPGWLFVGVSNTSGSALQWMAPGSNATARTASGVSLAVGASTTLALQSASSASVAVVFEAGAGAFQSLAYQSVLGIVLPAKVLGIPLADFVAVTAAAIVASLVIAGLVRRVRKRPSRMIYLSEEDA